MKRQKSKLILSSLLALIFSVAALPLRAAGNSENAPRGPGGSVRPVRALAVVSPHLAPQWVNVGKGPVGIDPRTAQFKQFIQAGPIAGQPAELDLSAGVKDSHMFLNDHLGCCVAAAPGHMILQWMHWAGIKGDISDKDILTAYENVGHYNPKDPSTDRGAIILDMLKYWRKTGVGGHKIDYYTSIDPTNIDHQKTAMWIFGGVDYGLRLPVSAQKQLVWDVVPGDDGGLWGGHSVAGKGFGTVGSFGIIPPQPQGPQTTPGTTLTGCFGHCTAPPSPMSRQLALQALQADPAFGKPGALVETWGQLKWMTWEFVKKYGDEAWAIKSPDFIVNGKTPNPPTPAFGEAALLKYIKLVTH